MPGFGSMGLQEPFGAQMGTVQGTTTPQGDTLPFAQAGTVPTATGSGWTMSPMPTFQVLALGTLPTGTTTLNWAQASLFTFTAYAGTFTLAFSGMQLGQQIQILATGNASATATWPASGITWAGVITGPALSNAAPLLTTAVAYVITLTCTAVGSSPTFVGQYIQA